MESIHTIEHTINVTAPCLYVSNLEENVMNDLEETFVGKCYGGFYIIKINEINNISNCRSISSNVNGISVINVCFDALTMTYTEDDIIPSVKICISQSQIMGKTDRSLITFIASPNNNILEKNQIIPVRVGYRIHYKSFCKRINILGSILLPQTSATVYKLEGYLGKGDIYDNYIKLIKEQESDLKSKESKFFIDLLNTYKNKSANKDSINIIDLIEKSKKDNVDIAGYWHKDLTQPSDSYLYIKQKNPPDENESIHITTKEAFKNMLHKAYAMRKGIIEMGKTYTPEMLEQSENVWTMMRRYKL